MPPCGGTFNASNNGTLRYPGHEAAGGRYGNNLECEWNIEVADGLAVKITIVELDVEDQVQTRWVRKGF